MGLIGVDLGGTQLRVAVADDRGRLKTVVRRPTEAARGRQHVINRIVATVKEALEEDGTPARRVRALGIGLPGPVDPAAGLVINPRNPPCLTNLPPHPVLTPATRIPPFLLPHPPLPALLGHRPVAPRRARQAIFATR